MNKELLIESLDFMISDVQSFTVEIDSSIQESINNIKHENREENPIPFIIFYSYTFGTVLLIIAYFISGQITMADQAATFVDVSGFAITDILAFDFELIPSIERRSYECVASFSLNPIKQILTLLEHKISHFHYVSFSHIESLLFTMEKEAYATSYCLNNGIKEKLNELSKKTRILFKHIKKVQKYQFYVKQ